MKLTFLLNKLATIRYLLSIDNNNNEIFLKLVVAQDEDTMFYLHFRSKRNLNKILLEHMLALK
jgi:hypothetical protein